MITLPSGTEMKMEVTLGCHSADVSVLDYNFVEVVSFRNVPVVGGSAFCGDRLSGYPLLSQNMLEPTEYDRDK